MRGVVSEGEDDDEERREVGVDEAYMMDAGETDNDIDN